MSRALLPKGSIAMSPDKDGPGRHCRDEEGDPVSGEKRARETVAAGEVGRAD